MLGFKLSSIAKFREWLLPEKLPQNLGLETSISVSGNATRKITGRYRAKLLSCPSILLEILALYLTAPEACIRMQGQCLYFSFSYQMY
jgi:hypothetical protein